MTKRMKKIQDNSSKKVKLCDEWDNIKDNFTIPTGMYMDVPGCSDNPMSILTAVNNDHTYALVEKNKDHGDKNTQEQQNNERIIHASSLQELERRWTTQSRPGGTSMRPWQPHPGRISSPLIHSKLNGAHTDQNIDIRIFTNI